MSRSARPRGGLPKGGMNRYSYSPHQSHSPIETLVTRPLYAMLCLGAIGGVLYLASSAGTRIEDRQRLAEATPRTPTESPRFALRAEEPALFPAGEVWEISPAGRGVLRASRNSAFEFQAFTLNPTWTAWREEGGRFFDLAVGADSGGEYLFRIQAHEVAALYALTPERRILIDRAPLRAPGEEPITIRRNAQRWSVMQGAKVLLELQLPSVTSHILSVVTTVPPEGVRAARLDWLLGSVPGSTAMGASAAEVS